MSALIILSVYALAVAAVMLIRGAEGSPFRGTREGLFVACLVLASLGTLTGLLVGPRCCLMSGLGLCLMVVGAVLDLSPSHTIVTEL